MLFIYMVEGGGWLDKDDDMLQPNTSFTLNQGIPELISEIKYSKAIINVFL